MNRASCIFTIMFRNILTTFSHHADDAIIQTILFLYNSYKNIHLKSVRFILEIFYISLTVCLKVFEDEVLRRSFEIFSTYFYDQIDRDELVQYFEKF